MLRSVSSLLTRPGAVLTSVALHAGAIIAGGHALSEGTALLAGASAPIEVEIASVDVPRAPVTPPRADEEAQPAAPVRTSSGHRHAYPVPPDHDAQPHDPALVHVLRSPPAQPAPPIVIAPVETPFTASPSAEEQRSDTPLHFVLSVSLATRGTNALPSTGPSGGSGVGNGHSNAPEAGTSDAIFPESAVDRPARLQSSVPVVYPEAARAAEIEADVLLELVVDGEGRVTGARPLAARDFGLTDAALRAVRAYRFTPAERAGHPVRVRMRWTVTFRLQ
jgi:protein TonB